MGVRSGIREQKENIGWRATARTLHLPPRATSARNWLDLSMSEAEILLPLPAGSIEHQQVR
jgi:hypothetical protein